MKVPPAAAVSSAARVVASNLRVDSATADVLRAFEVAQIESLLLKGVSIARWLYDPHDPRSYVDCDLLVRPADVTSAQAVLAELGFQPNLQEQDLPAWWQDHAIGWLRRQDAAIVDLHRTLSGVGVDDQRLWLTLSAEAEEIDVAGFRAKTLGVSARALHLALHAAQHGVEFDGSSLPDLERGIAGVGMGTWRQAAALAEALDATAAFGAGLRMVPAGRALAAALDLPTDQPVDVVLRAGTAPPIALGFDQLMRAQGVRHRLEIMRHKLVPPATFMRTWHPLARRGRLGLLVSYAWRPLWLLRHAPAGFRAWRAARRRSAT